MNSESMKMSFVIGHIGRFDEQKNHIFIVDIFENIAKRDQSAALLLVGAGPLLPYIKNKIAEKNLNHRVYFAGIRKDIPRILIGAIDVLLLPSLFEGLPLVGVEAQAAGKCLIRSEETPEEVDIVKALVIRISNKTPAVIWADEILKIKTQEMPIDKFKAIEIIKTTNFNILRGLRELERYYEGEYGKR